MPNLPKGRVRSVLFGQKYAPLCEPLRNLGIEALLLPDIPEVDERLSGHADLAVLHTADKIVLAGRAGEAIRPQLEKIGFKTELVSISGAKYPLDARLNACVLGDKIIHRSDISTLRGRNGFVDVRQGYAKCNVCPVSECAIITSDSGIAAACTAAKLDVLLLSPGHISLPGFDTGFIGGSAFLISSNIIAFTGTLSQHPDCKSIIEFLEEHNITPLYLTDNCVFDIGSAVLLTQEI